MNDASIVNWAREKTFAPIDIDCAISLMLKILDGKCKMNPEEKRVMAIVYDEIKHKRGELLDSQIHRLIASARKQLSDTVVEQVYEQRMYAEQMIGRPVMKSYKAMLRSEGILAG